MKIIFLTLALFSQLFIPQAVAAEAALRVTLHDSDGLSVASAPEGRLELILFADHTHLHLRVTNLTDQPVTLWKPFCPEGDHSILVEFRDPATPHKVLRATPGWDYTGGMGIPKTFSLAAHDDLIVNVNFVSDSDWILPMRIAKDERRELEVRVGYRSRNLDDKTAKQFENDKLQKVWEGEVIGDWHRIVLSNRSGKAIGEKKQ